LNIKIVITSIRCSSNFVLLVEYFICGLKNSHFQEFLVSEATVILDALVL
jgi:hypothetical protein